MGQAASSGVFLVYFYLSSLHLLPPGYAWYVIRIILMRKSIMGRRDFVHYAPTTFLHLVNVAFRKWRLLVTNLHAYCWFCFFQPAHLNIYSGPGSGSPGHFPVWV